MEYSTHLKKINDLVIDKKFKMMSSQLKIVIKILNVHTLWSSNVISWCVP